MGKPDGFEKQTRHNAERMGVSKHTPGPWTAQLLLPDGLVIRGEPAWEIATPEWDVATQLQYRAPIRKEADAHLIAAAPDLLEACYWGLASLQEHAPLNDDQIEIQKQMRAAVAKAEGES